MFDSLKKKWRHFLETVAKQNKTTYGEGDLHYYELQDTIHNHEVFHKRKG